MLRYFSSASQNKMERSLSFREIFFDGTSRAIEFAANHPIQTAFFFMTSVILIGTNAASIVSESSSEKDELTDWKPLNGSCPIQYPYSSALSSYILDIFYKNVLAVSTYLSTIEWNLQHEQISQLEFDEYSLSYRENAVPPENSFTDNYFSALIQLPQNESEASHFIEAAEKIYLKNPQVTQLCELSELLILEGKSRVKVDELLSQFEKNIPSYSKQLSSNENKFVACAARLFEKKEFELLKAFLDLETREMTFISFIQMQVSYVIAPRQFHGEDLFVPLSSFDFYSNRGQNCRFLQNYNAPYCQRLISEMVSFLKEQGYAPSLTERGGVLNTPGYSYDYFRLTHRNKILLKKVLKEFSSMIFFHDMNQALLAYDAGIFFMVWVSIFGFLAFGVNSLRNQFNPDVPNDVPLREIRETAALDGPQLFFTPRRQRPPLLFQPPRLEQNSWPPGVAPAA